MFSRETHLGAPRGRGVGPGRRSTVAVLALTMVLAAGCSSEGSDGGGPDRTTTTKASTEKTTTSTDRTTTSRATTTTSDRTTTTTTDATTTTTDATTTTTEAAAKGGATTPTEAPRAPSSYTGVVDGQEGDGKVTFTRGAGIEDFELSGLVIECQPLAETGDVKSRIIHVAIDAAPVAADGSVMFTQTDATYEPSLSGAFAGDGTFAGALFLSGESDGFVCGGEFSFTAAPG